MANYVFQEEEGEGREKILALAWPEGLRTEIGIRREDAIGPDVEKLSLSLKLSELKEREDGVHAVFSFT